jgi:adenine-specific DNA methylase
MGDESDGVCRRLIEVALPIRELSAESVRDKNIHHAHISHLHIWWARRPLAASRGVVFASLVPDPDDAHCPEAFRKAVERYLRAQVPEGLRYYRRRRETVADEDPYRPYHGMDDTLRNRLLMFIARWSREYLDFEGGRSAEPPGPPLLLDDRCLAKWEICDPKNAQGHEVLRVARELVRVANDGRRPVVLDPFAGGGAIPLEVGRLGGEAIANEYNPVAHLLLRATCEYPQKYGRAGKRKVVHEEFGRKVGREVDVANVLVHDFDQLANRILNQARAKIGHLYPAGKDGRPVLAYLWARTVPCSNPSCRGEVPLLRSLLLRSKGGKVALTLGVDKARKEIRFGIGKGRAVEETDGTKTQRGPAKCPFCREPTSENDLRAAGIDGKMKERMVAVVVQGKTEKDYRPVEETDLRASLAAEAFQVDLPGEYIVPEINSPGASRDAGSHRSINLELYGFTRWGQLFNHRQLVVMDQLVRGLHEAIGEMEREVPDADYRRALATYLALWIDRVAAFGNTFTRWRASHQKSETPFSGQSVPMMWDYPEVNPFANSSGTASTQLEYMLKVVLHEQTNDAAFASPRVILGSATELNAVESGSCDCVVTDPPYGNSIAYADLSDFFYVWLKRSLGDLLPEAFPTPQTPKEQEATSHKHRHNGSQVRANEFYRRVLTESFKEGKRVAKEPKLVTVMFAHQSTEAWAALLSGLFDAGLCPDATWPIATEMPNTALALGTASLETSVTVACRPRIIGAAESLKNVRKEIEQVVHASVERFWGYGFRGADLVVACYGPAVGVFGKYERVERGDGTRVEVPELLDLARLAARDAIAGDFRGDNLSTLYYVWANLYGAAEQAWDDARLVVQIGGDAENAMEVARGHGIFVVDGSTCRLALLGDRAQRRGLGMDPNPPLIDALHQAMLLWKEEKRPQLVAYLAERDLIEDGPFWKLAQALFEVMPRDGEDWKLVSALLSERPTLRTEAKRATVPRAQRELNLT